MSSSTQADLDEVLIRIRVCEAVTAAYKAGVEELQAEHCDTTAIDRQLVVKELELGLLKTRRDEIADELFSYGRHVRTSDQASLGRDVGSRPARSTSPASPRLDKVAKGSR